MSEEEVNKCTLDLSRKQLKKVPKQDNAQNVRILKLDENELQKIDNIDSYLKIETLSLSKNQLLRMYGICRLHCLRDLNLSYNGILSIEGLKDCVHLRHLNLEGNNIKTIEHLNTNTKLEYLNLSENSIGNISDVSFLTNLKELYLHGNRLTHLRQCDKYLPVSLEIVTLAKNFISDLNEISTLSHLCNLYSLTISENPCVSMTNGPDGFDHRPFVLNWCMSVKIIDGFAVDPIESLKAEWLYSQGRGRQFRLGEHASLAKYLSSVCPLIGKALENENERKLRLILSKAQQHQRQLQEESSENALTSGSSSPLSGRKKPASRMQSPRFSRLSGRQGSPEAMIRSYHGNTSSDPVSNNNFVAQMTTSLIENIKNDSLTSQKSESGSGVSGGGGGGVTPAKSNDLNSAGDPASRPLNSKQNFVNQCVVNCPLAAASKMVPVPETLMSPDVCPSLVAQRVTVSAINSQLHNTKAHKNLDNRFNLPKIRSPQLKRNAERTSNTSPRKNQIADNLSYQQNAANMTKIAGNKPLSNNQTKQQQIQQQQQQLQQHHQLQQQLQQQQQQRQPNNSTQAPGVEMSACPFSSDDESENINVDKLKTIRNKAALKCQKKRQNAEQTKANSGGSLNADTETSAVLIQKMWRGYRTRKKTKDIAEKLLKIRTQEYILKLTKDMEVTKAQLENERKIQQLQMQAISALWKKVSTMHGNGGSGGGGGGGSALAGALPMGEATEDGTDGKRQPQNADNCSTAVVSDLAKTCSLLTCQVQQLQGSMRDILNCLSLFCNLPQENIKKLLAAGVADSLSNGGERDSAATQTEIVAVHTPQLESQSSFPFAKMRPSSLPLTDAQKHASMLGGADRKPPNLDVANDVPPADEAETTAADASPSVQEEDTLNNEPTKRKEDLLD